MITPKQRMLNAYRGEFSDRYPVAPEFWYYYPAKVMGVDMVRFQREVAFWEALKKTFRKYGTEGWGCVSAGASNPDVKASSDFRKISDRRFRDTQAFSFRGMEFRSSQVYDLDEPSWAEEYPAKDEEDLKLLVDMSLSPENIFDYSAAVRAHREVGEDYLLEYGIGAPFFDYIAGFMGFESAVSYFMSGNDAELEGYLKRYVECQAERVRQAAQNTDFESFFIGCSFSCSSLIGPSLWRKWDKPCIKAVCEEVHKCGRLLHIHFHGRSMETARDFAEIGIDCVCPFERPPGGDIAGAEGLAELRRRLGGKVTMNGNIHTVETLIRGKPRDVREEVRQVAEAFRGSARLIFGTGDQVGRETPEENIFAMVEECRKIPAK